MADNTSGGWGEYQRLVLAELERHNSLLQTIDTRIQSLKVEIELLKQTHERLANVESQVRTNTDRINKIQNVEETDDALKKYRNWIIGVLFIFITALLIPTVTLILHAVGGK
jgi:FtsZ-binding cell division protein ZapB